METLRTHCGGLEAGVGHIQASQRNACARKLEGFWGGRWRRLAPRRWYRWWAPSSCSCRVLLGPCNLTRTLAPLCKFVCSSQALPCPKLHHTCDTVTVRCDRKLHHSCWAPSLPAVRQQQLSLVRNGWTLSAAPQSVHRFLEIACKARWSASFAPKQCNALGGPILLSSSHGLATERKSVGQGRKCCFLAASVCCFRDLREAAFCPGLLICLAQLPDKLLGLPL